MFAVNIAIRQFCLQLTTISCGLAVNSSYCDIIDYPNNVQRILQKIVIMYFWLAHRPTSYACLHAHSTGVLCGSESFFLIASQFLFLCHLKCTVICG